MAILRVWESEGNYKDWAVPLGETELGCEVTSANAIRLPKREFISRVHAVIFSTPEGTWKLRDCSSNGTIVNSTRIHKLTIVLADGARISFASAVDAVFSYSSFEQLPPICPAEPPEQPRPPSEAINSGPSAPPQMALSVIPILEDLRGGVHFVRTEVINCDGRVQRLRVVVDALSNDVLDPDPERARSSLVKQLEKSGDLNKQTKALAEVFEDLRKALDDLDRRLKAASEQIR